ncbi:hypothetical protein AT395_04935 [Pandoraea apista]|nr:hypothetical protein AT395_04935 [Pandoraea apista]
MQLPRPAFVGECFGSLMRFRHGTRLRTACACRRMPKQAMDRVGHSDFAYLPLTMTALAANALDVIRS